VSKINCSVDSCRYWGRGNICEAGEISVSNELSGKRKKDTSMEAGSLGCGVGEAGRSLQTQCVTFRPKER